MCEQSFGRDRTTFQSAQAIGTVSPTHTHTHTKNVTNMKLPFRHYFQWGENLAFDQFSIEICLHNVNHSEYFI